MTAGVWRHRQVGRGGYEIEVTDQNGRRQIVGLVMLEAAVARPSSVIRQIVHTIAASQGGIVAPEVELGPVTDWARLGWADMRA
jgi:hypothetical protein